jgi:hypothetical protein
VLHKLRGITVAPDLVARAEETEVLGVRIPVLPPTPIMIAKLHSLSENYGDFGAMLPAFRAVREQLDWDEVRSEVSDRPFAEAFLFLLERLEIAPAGARTRGGREVLRTRAATYVYVGFISLRRLPPAQGTGNPAERSSATGWLWDSTAAYVIVASLARRADDRPRAPRRHDRPRPPGPSGRGLRGDRRTRGQRLRGAADRDDERRALAHLLPLRPGRAAAALQGDGRRR